MDDCCAQERPSQQAKHDCADRKEPVPVKTHDQRQAFVALDNRLHDEPLIFHPMANKMPSECVSNLANRPRDVPTLRVRDRKYRLSGRKPLILATQ